MNTKMNMSTPIPVILSEVAASNSNSKNKQHPAELNEIIIELHIHYSNTYRYTETNLGSWLLQHTQTDSPTCYYRDTWPPLHALLR